MYNTGATGLSYVNDRIEENPTLASVKTTAATGATQIAHGATQMASQAAGYMGGFFGWGSSNPSTV